MGLGSHKIKKLKKPKKVIQNQSITVIADMNLSYINKNIPQAMDFTDIRLLNARPTYGSFSSYALRRKTVPQGRSSAEFDELLNRVKIDRCEDSFKILFEHFYPKVLNYIKTNVKGQKSQDLAQETMLLVWHKASTFDSNKGPCHAWIFTIARNLRYDHFRSNARDIISVGADDLYFDLEDNNLKLDDQIFAKDIRKHIDTLPADQKDAVEAMYFKGHSHGEYAALKKLPLGTVKSRIRLALSHLKKRMEDL